MATFIHEGLWICKATILHEKILLSCKRALYSPL